METPFNTVFPVIKVSVYKLMGQTNHTNHMFPGCARIKLF
jgi:hypothetical protein